MNGGALSAITKRLILPSNVANQHESTITTYAEAANDLLGRYATDLVIVKTDEKICNLNHISLTQWGFFKGLWDRPLQCSVVYNEQTWRGFFVEGIDPGVSAVLCYVDGRIAERLRSRTWTIKSSPYWIYNIDTRKPPK